MYYIFRNICGCHILVIFPPFHEHDITLTFDFIHEPTLHLHLCVHKSRMSLDDRVKTFIRYISCNLTFTPYMILLLLQCSKVHSILFSLDIKIRVEKRKIIFNQFFVSFSNNINYISFYTSLSQGKKSHQMNESKLTLMSSLLQLP